MMDRAKLAPQQQAPSESVEPLLFERRDYLDEIEPSASTTACQTTAGPVKDYGPDD